MSPVARIYLINLAVLLAQALGLRLLNPPMSHGEGELNFLILLVVGIAAQLAVNFGLALFATDPPRRQAYWLSLLLVLLVGFGVCGGASLTY